MKDEVRWIQRLNNWSKALNQLSRFIAKGELDELQEQGLIQSFEYNHELAWKTQKDFLQERGVTELYGSKDVTRAAFSSGLITNPQPWMDMIADRNLTSHTYNQDVTKKILAHIVDDYYAEFQSLHKKLTKLALKTVDG